MPVKPVKPRAFRQPKEKDTTMLKKFAIALVSTALIAGPALAQNNNAGSAPANAAQPAAKVEVKTDGKGTATQATKPEVKTDAKADVKTDTKTTATVKPVAPAPEVKKDAKPEKRTQLHKGKSTKHGKKPVEKTLG